MTEQQTRPPRNEAAARLYGAIHDEAPNESWEGELKELARAALREQTRITVEAVRESLTDEDEIAHGEAWDDVRKQGRGHCAYCDDEWPCRTQQGIDRLLAALPRTPGEGGAR